jgi:hypothetical protein
MKYTCIQKCFFRARVWAVGETLQSAPDEQVPKFFTSKEVKPAPVIPVDDPKSFAEYQRKEARELLNGVGRGEQAAKDPNDIFG